MPITTDQKTEISLLEKRTNGRGTWEWQALAGWLLALVIVRRCSFTASRLAFTGVRTGDESQRV
jgi:hypothetical protein